MGRSQPFRGKGRRTPLSTGTRSVIMAAYVYKTVDFGKSWTPVVNKDSSVRGYAHVIKEDLVSSRLLFLGTEFGLWVSLDAGEHWAQYKGHDFPNVAVRDIALHPRSSDLVLATHGGGFGSWTTFLRSGN